MGHFEVQPETLTALASDLKSVGQHVSSARQGLEDLGERDTGDGGLASSLHEFAGKWKYSLEKIAKSAEQTGEKVGSARQTYASTDQSIADAAAGAQ